MGLTSIPVAHQLKIALARGMTSCSVICSMETPVICIASHVGSPFWNKIRRLKVFLKINPEGSSSEEHSPSNEVARRSTEKCVYALSQMQPTSFNEHHSKNVFMNRVRLFGELQWTLILGFILFCVSLLFAGIQ